MIYYGRETSYNTLTHHGVKGMKWGVRKQRELVGRRSANPDRPRPTMKERLKSAKKWTKEHKKQILIGTAVVAGLAVAGIALNERRVKNRYVTGYNAIANTSVDEFIKETFSDGTVDRAGFGLNRISRSNMGRGGYMYGERSKPGGFLKQPVTYGYREGAGDTRFRTPRVNVKDRFRSGNTIRQRAVNDAIYNRDTLRRAAINRYYSQRGWA